MFEVANPSIGRARFRSILPAALRGVRAGRPPAAQAARGKGRLNAVIPAEGFGLTVADAVWKGRAVAASGSLPDYSRLIRCVLERSGIRAAA
jgi:hypothetical protein